MESILINTWGSVGKNNGEFNHPTGIAIGNDGTIYVSDTYNNRIQLFTSNGTFISKWCDYGDKKDDKTGEYKSDDKSGRISEPRGITIGTYDKNNANIKRLMLMVPELLSFPPGLLPICLGYFGDECLYVADCGSHYMKVFEANKNEAKFIRKWGGIGREDGYFDTPWSCAIGGSNSSILFYVSDYNNDRYKCLIWMENLFLNGVCMV